MKRPLFDPPKSLDEQVRNAEDRGDDLQQHARIGKMCGCGDCFCCAALRRLEEKRRGKVETGTFKLSPALLNKAREVWTVTRASKKVFVVQPVKFERTDCGRAAAGFAREDGKDCTVRATAAVLEISYEVAHRRMAALGRKPRKGVEFKKFAPRLGLIPHPEFSCMTVRKLMPLLAAGRWAVRIAGHVFAVVDGVIHDTRLVRLGSRVRMVYGLTDQGNP